jgi:RIB43A
MKRTKENWKEPQPKDRNGISGLMYFDGEDTKYEDRKKIHQETQKNWIEEKKIENQNRINHEKQQEMLYARQTLNANRNRGLLQDQFELNRKMMQQSVRDANLQLKMEKEAKLKYEKALKVQEEQADLQYQRDIREKGMY